MRRFPLVSRFVLFTAFRVIASICQLLPILCLFSYFSFPWILFVCFFFFFFSFNGNRSEKYSARIFVCATMRLEVDLQCSQGFQRSRVKISQSRVFAEPREANSFEVWSTDEFWRREWLFRRSSDSVLRFSRAPFDFSVSVWIRIFSVSSANF